MGEGKADEWWLTAQPGDRFTGGMVTREWDGCDIHILWDSETEVTWYEGDEVRILSGVKVDHVGNMRRAVARVLREGGVMELHGIVAGWDSEESAYEVLTWDDEGDMTKTLYDTPEQAAEALIPDDWRPGGAS